MLSTGFKSRRPGAHGSGPAAATARRGAATVVAHGVIITGDVAGEDEVRVDGVVDGSVACRALVVETDGRVEGTVRADTVRIAGEFRGDVDAEAVTLAATARVHGDVVVGESLAVEAGAVFEGATRRRDTETNVARLGESQDKAGRAKVAAAG